MKVTRKQAEVNRQRVLSAAATLLREKGLDGVGIAEIMSAVGLSHGGFYGQFGSKDDLAAQAITEAAKSFPTPELDPTAKPIAAIAAWYLSSRHRDDPSSGCVVAALAGDVARRTGPVRDAFTTALRVKVDRLAAILPGTRAERRRRALATMATLVGGMVLARAVGDGEFSDELLAAAAASLSEQEEA